MNPKIMLLKLFKWPLLFVALFLGLALGAEILVNTWREQKLLAGALKGILPFFKYGLFGLAAATVISAIAALHKLWVWIKGEGDRCSRCDGITVYKPDGRYGPYFKCLACNANEKALNL